MSNIPNLPVIRKEGLDKDYNSTTFKNTLYFATDSKKLYYNGIDYSSCIVDGSIDENKLNEALKKEIKTVETITKGADERYDTFKEVGDWIDNHEKTIYDTIAHNVGALIEIELDTNKYDDIIDSKSGVIKKLDNFSCKCNVTRGDFESRGEDIKFVRISKPSDAGRTTLMNMTFMQPGYGVFCAYSINKSDDYNLGIGYATMRYNSSNANETTLKITSIHSTMPFV